MGDWTALVNAVASDRNSNILSSPSITVMDNGEASFIVGEEVPVVTGSTSSSNNDNPFQTVERKEVGGIKLNVVPQINEGDSVQLKIEQEVSNVLGAEGGAVDVRFSKRQLTTSVLVQDGQMIALGGLIQEQVDESEQKIPILGDIPILGHLFKSTNTTKSKTNLMVFIKPTIIRDGVTADGITQRKYNYIRAEQLYRADKGLRLMPDTKTPVLPKYGEDISLPPEVRAFVAPAGGAVMETENPVAAFQPLFRLPFSFAKRHRVVLESAEQGWVLFYSGSLTAPPVLAEVRRVAGGGAFTPQELGDKEFELKLTDAYQRDSSEARQLMEDLGSDSDDFFSLAEELPETEDLLESEDDAPIIKLINAMLAEAIKEAASDIHIETFEKVLSIRFRVDGVLREVLQPSRKLAPLLVSRIKVMARLDIAEKRVPQDGRISLRIGGRAVDVRVSTMPSSHGERVVLRLLDKNATRLDLYSLGMTPGNHKNFQHIISVRMGLFWLPVQRGRVNRLPCTPACKSSMVRNAIS